MNALTTRISSAFNYVRQNVVAGLSLACLGIASLICQAQTAHAQYVPPTMEDVIEASNVEQMIGTGILALAGLLLICATGYVAFLVVRVMLAWSGKALGK